jgi:hypothetical protein
MRALLGFLIAMAVIAYIQSVRNECYWHGRENVAAFLACLIEF